MNNELVRARIVVRGRVQMVGYRAFALREAGVLAGTVANLPDRSVECIVEGPRAAVEHYVGRLRQGPSAARVEAVDVSWEAPAGLAGPMRVTA